MSFPTLREYKDAIESGPESFRTLKTLSPVLDGYGEPYRVSGNFAVVFKMSDSLTGKHYALKCFHRDNDDISAAYRKISAYLEKIDSNYLVRYRFIEDELRVRSSHTERNDFPVLLMEWVEGKNLRESIRHSIDTKDKDHLELLSFRFDLMAVWMLDQEFAHGDLKPDNIIVTESDSLVLVDYDGMFVPEMEGESARENGTPGFRNPYLWEQEFFNRHRDDFSIMVISMALGLLAFEPGLYHETKSDEHLIFKEEDLKSPASNILWQRIRELVKFKGLKCGILVSLYEYQDANMLLFNSDIQLLKPILSDERQISGRWPSTLRLKAWMKDYKKRDNNIDLLFQFNKKIDEGPICTITMSPDSRILAAVGGDDLIRIYGFNDFTKLFEIDTSGLSVYSLCFSPEGRFLLYSGNSSKLYIYDFVLNTTEVKEDHSGNITDVKYSKNGKTLVTCGHDNKINIYDASSRKHIKSIIHDAGSVYSISINNDGNHIVFGGEGKKIYTYDLEEAYKDDYSSSQRVSENGEISNICHSPDEKFIQVTLLSGKVKIYNRLNNTIRKYFFSEYQADQEALQSAFSPDSRIMITCGDFPYLLLHNSLEFDNTIAIDTQNQKINIAIFTPNGEYVICGSTSGNILVYKVAEIKLTRRVRALDPDDYIDLIKNPKIK
jgi:WD40 repeat protein